MRALRLLVTRPEPDAQRTAAALRTLGHDVLVMPMLRVETLADVNLGRGPWVGVVMTSANAARAIAAHQQFATVRALPAFVVGERTREVAQAAGFTDVISADGDTPALGQLVAARVSPSGPLLYLAGEQRTGDLEQMLQARGFGLHIAVIYRAMAVSELSRAAKTALAAGELDGILHFSKRSAEALVSSAKAAGILIQVMALRHYCLSPQVAAALAGHAADVVAAPHPSEQALLDLIG